MAAESPLIDLFGRSPVKPIQEHISKARECAELLPVFLDAVVVKDWQQAELVRKQISEKEHEADAIKKDIRLHLPNSLFMPVPRSDLLELLTVQDKIANVVKDISGVMLGRKMEVPATLVEQFMAYAKQAVSVVVQAHEIVAELDELMETSFRGIEAERVHRMVVVLDELETNSDQHERVIRQGLMALERELPPIDVMFLYQVIEEIGVVADHAQRVGARLQILLAR
ncbi:TIGR00153 family protein [Salinibius halmophilus]|uniref:TIGR00153 family protein n=1 Tax=Salinibius halmophilus TaxID=1853216 RepID=UPI000E66BB8B|nr:TIGR00153 family protein [Salinibius halmophilus]